MVWNTRRWSSPNFIFRADNSQGTAGLGAQCVKALAKHLPEQIYFTGRNTCAGDKLIQEVKVDNPAVSLKFIKLDMNSLLSVKQAIQESFMHDRLDIVICNAGIMASPPGKQERVPGLPRQFQALNQQHKATACGSLCHRCSSPCAKSQTFNRAEPGWFRDSVCGQPFGSCYVDPRADARHVQNR